LRSISYAVEKRLKGNDSYPSVILIDGGTQQLYAAIDAVKSSHITYLAIKKGSKRKALTETIYSLNGQEEIAVNSELFKLLLKARDEAHRFAIKSNRNSSLKSIKGSKLDTIKGIGPKKRMMLINKYGSVNNICSQTEDELMTNKGIDRVLASALARLNKL